MNPIDDRFYMQLFTPRKAKSAWSPSNKARVERLRAGGLMTEAGEAAIARAKDTGTWDTPSGIDSLTVPTALRKALNANPAASANWPTFTDSQRKQYLLWLLSRQARADAGHAHVRDRGARGAADHAVSGAGKKAAQTVSFARTSAITRSTTTGIGIPVVSIWTASGAMVSGDAARVVSDLSRA